MINSMEYYNDFWNNMRGNRDISNRINGGRETKTNAYYLPTTSSKKYMEALQRESVARQLATVVNPTKGDNKIYTSDYEGQANWGEGDAVDFLSGEDDFKRFEIQAHRLSKLVRLGVEFASDHAFAIEDYVIKKIARSFGKSEEMVFINGTGEGQPTGILHGTKGGQIGVTTEDASAISYDEVIKLYFSLDKKYRKNGVWLMNDETALAFRTLKDFNGNYLWRDSDETIFSKPVQIVDSMPSMGAGQKVIAFGDFSQYWLVQRFPVTLRTLREKFIMSGQIGYLGCEYLDGKLIRQEAVKVLQMAKE